ncbi:MAG: hypothetical protein KDB00_17060 [Planctomycetales bacterium]|nr:hypothetical protein [Planctomycetales bacterium]
MKQVTSRSDQSTTMLNPRMIRRTQLAFGLPLLAILCAAWSCPEVFAQTRLSEPPIRYLDTKGDNAITDLIAKVDAGEIELNYQQGSGYVLPILDALDIPVSSQSLVFSKTSLQTGSISPANPRAIYFGDDVYVAWVQGSRLLEISVADPTLGAVYYSMNMSPNRPYLRRENNRCLVCHEKTVGHGKIPIHTIQSVAARENGSINLLLKSFVTDHTSPIHQRWGGWYVTGDHGLMRHMGNSFLVGEEMVSQGPSQVETLRQHFDLSRWPSPSSDIVALMVMEHQTEMQNRLTDANYAVRRARFIHQDTSVGDQKAIETAIDASAKLVVDHLLFTGEPQLESEIKCSNSFTLDFAEKGPKTEDGKSLRQFDLKRRLFRYPCSYTIYSKAFDGLDRQLQDGVYRKLWQVLTRQDNSPEYAHLDGADRASILQILRQTKTGLPEYWSAATPADRSADAGAATGG